MERIINLTQHFATLEQKAAGVIEPTKKENVKEILTFNDLPTKEDMQERAKKLVEIAKESNVEKALIGGAPYFMSTLENALKEAKIQPIYAYSKRVSKEIIRKEDGSIEKNSVFQHKGFIEI